jgi:hypothetical protein
VEEIQVAAGATDREKLYFTIAYWTGKLTPEKRASEYTQNAFK